MLLLLVRLLALLFEVTAAFRAAICASDMKLGRYDVPPLGDVGQEFAALKNKKTEQFIQKYIALYRDGH